MKHILSIVCYFLSIFILLGCPSPISDSNMGYYLQQSKTAKDDSGGGPSIDWDDDDDSGSGSDVVLPPGSISIFSALQPDGKMLTCATTAVAGKLGGSDASYTGYVYDTERFENWKILGTFSATNVPYLNYNGDAPWSAPSADGSNMQYFNGPNSNAGSNSITEMKYYRYKEVNPFFAPDSSYNTADFIVYDGETETTEKEPLMKRFYFYRFSGKGGGVAPLDNMLVAVDTYTKLVFSFAKPTKWGSLLGNAVPLEWGPVDLCSTGPGGKKYKFYEYDPSGYVTDDGKFHMTDSYMSNQSSGNYDPSFTGKSPYLLGAINSDGSSSGGGGGETGYTVSGALTVKAKYIKNISMTDAWGDRGNGDGVDSPEFIYSVRSRAYSGFEAGEWNAMSYYKPNDSDMMPAGAKPINKGATLLLGGGKEYVFDKIASGLTLELDSRIIEIDMVGNDNLTDYETPIIFLGYDRYSQKWMPKADNDTYLRGPLEYDENFQVGLGETEDFIVTVPAGNGAKIELCYEISWKSDSSTDTGRIFSVQTKNKGTGYLFSGSSGIYDIEYIDLTEASSKEDKTVSIELILGNLHSEVPVVVDYEKENVVSGFLGEPTFDGHNLAQVVITAAEPTLKIDIPLAYSPSNTQEGTLTLTFSDSSGALSIYDKNASPDKIVINIIRNKFIPISDAILAISNVKLKNLSVMDVGGDQPWGGYNQPEFSWNIKTRHNELEWKELSTNNNGATLIQTDQTRSLLGTVDHNITNPREGTQTVYFSAAITERDDLAFNDDDIIMKHEEPLIAFGYNPLSDSWNLTGRTAFYFTSGSDHQWQVKKITMDDAVRDRDAQKVTVSLSSFIGDTIWPSDNIADWINGPITAGWGDMELTFDIEWISK